MQTKSSQSSVNHIEYKKNFLKNVIFRLDFNSLEQLSNNAPPEFGNVIAEKYHSPAQGEVKHLQVSISADGTKTIKEESNWIWKYEHKGSTKKSISLLKDALIFECHETGYKNFSTFEEDVCFIFNKFIDLYDVKQFGRIGLRYINEIFIPENKNPLKWQGYINPNLCNALESGIVDGSTPIRSMHQVQIKLDEIDVLFNYGIFNRDYPNPIAKPELILDYDYYISGMLEKNDVLSKLVSLNAVSRRMFEYSIENQLREKMEIIHEKK
ncbi:MAG: TIGR04255 family protein [Legionella sp.]|uniref:TIGR04255 family protein n=1 Tax=Legionella sp. TaxID=459 RepID=UPI0028421BC5|nr:TIGR04255 family protein [Legionella sp.]